MQRLKKEEYGIQPYGYETITIREIEGVVLW